ncbi:Uncharacterised protein [Salmonella enterica]|nr:Uncharacterised protein [Salmonella enterica]
MYVTGVNVRSQRRSNLKDEEEIRRPDKAFAIIRLFNGRRI